MNQPPGSMTKQYWQLKMFIEIATALLSKYPRLRIRKWCSKLPGQAKGDVDLLIEVLIKDKWYVIIHGELWNWSRRSVGSMFKLRNYRYSINMAIKSGELLVHPNYRSVLIFCGGRQVQSHLLLGKLRWRMFKCDDPIGPEPTEYQRIWATQVMREIFDTAMFIAGPVGVTRSMGEGGYSTQTTETTPIVYTQAKLWRFSGSGS